MADGSITIDTQLDNKQLEQELARISKRIDTINDKLYQKQQERTAWAEQSVQMMHQLDAEKAKLDSMMNTGAPKVDIKEQAERVKGLQQEWNRVQGTVERYDAQIQNAKIALDTETEKAGELSRKLAQAGNQGEKMAEAVKRAGKSAEHFATRLKSVVASALVFTVVTRALTSFRDWMGKVIQANDQARSSIAQLKGALLTLAQPLVSVIIPAFTALVNVLAKVVAAVAQVMAMLFGQTIDQSKEAAGSLYEETEAIEGVGGAAKEASKPLAAFDDINQVSFASGASGGGGAGGAKVETAPSFDFETSATKEQLENILGLVTAIGLAFLAWKLSSSFGEGIVKFVGLFLTLNGAIGLAKETFDAWTNGVTWDNFLGMLGRSAELVLGLWMVFGKLGAGIGLILTGITLLVTAFHDAEVNGWNLQNTLMAVAGILATGLGIAVLAGSWIPALIAGVAAILLAITNAMGHGEELIAGIKSILEGFKDFFVGIFTGDIELAIGGIGKIVDGLKGIVLAVFDSIRDLILSFLDWLDEKTGGKLHGIISFIKGLVSGLFASIRETFVKIMDSVKEILSGLVEFVSGVFTGNWDRAWQGVKNVFKGVFNGVVSILEGAVNLIIKGINWLISQLNKIHVDMPGWVEDLFGVGRIGFDIPSIPEVNIPRLAQGAVIPPNREFLAVLGDQKSGTNIETPLSTMTDAFKASLAEMGLTGKQDIQVSINFTGDLAQLARTLRPELDKASKLAGVRLVKGV